MANSYLLLGDGSTFLSIGDSASFLLLDVYVSEASLDHQWDNKILPEFNVTIAYHVVTGVGYLVTKLIRYNRSPAREMQYACTVVNQVNGKSGVADVWYVKETDSWKCNTYVPIRYRDEDGVKKNM